jgi:TolA-binding protein
MDELGEELRDVKREIIESRGLIIKTNNLTNALAADIKSVGKRQQSFERRAIWNSAAANLLFVFVVLVVVKFAWGARVESVEQETRRAKAHVADLELQLASNKKAAETRAHGEAEAAAFYELMRSGKPMQLVNAYDRVTEEPLTRAERAFFRDAVERVRAQLSASAYHDGMEAVGTGRWQEAVSSLEKSLRYKDTGAHSPSAQLLLAKAYRRLNRQRDAIAILTKLSEASSDAEVQDDAMFLLAECLIDIAAYNDAKTTLRSFIRRFPKSPFVNDAKMALVDLRTRH